MTPKAIANRINNEGRYYLTPSVLKGQQMIRVSIGSQATELSDVQGLWEAMRQAALERAPAVQSVGG